jgi:hypothetical protein
MWWYSQPLGLKRVAHVVMTWNFHALQVAAERKSAFVKEFTERWPATMVQLMLKGRSKKKKKKGRGKAIPVAGRGGL